MPTSTAQRSDRRTDVCHPRRSWMYGVLASVGIKCRIIVYRDDHPGIDKRCAEPSYDCALHITTPVHLLISPWCGVGVIDARVWIRF